MTHDVQIWRVRLNRPTPLASTPEEAERAARFATPILQRRYLRAHAALRDILRRYTDAPLHFALHEKGKPYLTSAPDLHFNLAHSRDLALIAIAPCEVGIDIERIRPLPDYAAIAQRYFPSDAPAPTSARDFFRHWTRFEALLKAQGAGLFGISDPPPGEWTVTPLDVGTRFAAALATQVPPRAVIFHEYDKETE